MTPPPFPAESQASLVFASASCNRQPGALTTLPSHGLAAYAALNNAFILSTHTQSVTSVLPLHTSPINAVKLIYNQGVHLFAADSDGNVSHASFNQTWSFSSWAAHPFSCVALDVLVTASGQLLLITVGEEGGLKVWELEKDWQLLASQPISIGPRGRDVLPECIAAFELSGGTILIALGGTDPAVQLYVLHEQELSFHAFLQGHRDWIRGLAFHQTDNAILLATASTDATARLWKITEIPDETATLTISLSDKTLCFTKMALLDEHTKAVHTVSFCDGHLLTASMDCSVAVWLPSEQTTCVARFGLMGGASAHALGFFGAEFASGDASHIIAHNFSGALHRWRLVEKSNTSYQYVAHPAPTGHFGPVSDIAWSPRGDFLLSCSVDKTARIFSKVGGRFVEWARPQVHGHSVFTVAFCDESGRVYVSGAEERMLRLFEAPTSFQVEGLHGASSDTKQPMGACMPQLGLSNKPVFPEDAGEGVPQGLDPVSSFGVDRAASPIPLEEDLNQHRLWPETAKLYGHGNEISCVAVDIQNNVLASACRAQNERDAAIILWDVSNGVECGRLAVHELTVNQMRFTEDGSALLSASKDRSFAVIRKGDSQYNFSVALRRKTAHTRVLYCCSWIKDGEIVATGSRDKSIKLFAVDQSVEAGGGMELQKFKFDTAVTSLDSRKRRGTTLLAAGFESGDIRVFMVQGEGDSLEMQTILKCEDNLRCGLRVSHVQWRPRGSTAEEEREDLQLGIGSDDCSVRVYSFRIE